MPKISPRQEEERRNQIIDAAFTCFLRKGYHLTTMNDLVQESKLSKGAIYHYFPCKEEIFLSLADREIFKILNRFEEISRKSSTVQESLEKGIAMVFDFSEKDFLAYSQISFEFWSQTPRNSKLKKRLEDKYRVVEKILEETIVLGVERKEFRNDICVESFISFLLLSIDGICLHKTLRGKNFKRKSVQDFFTGLIMKRILKEDA